MHFATRVRTEYSISTDSAFVKMCGIFYSTPTMSLSAVTTANWRFTLIHMREGRTVLNAKSKLLYSEVALSQKPFGIGHMYIYTFYLTMIDVMTSQNIELSFWNILYIKCCLSCLCGEVVWCDRSSDIHRYRILIVKKIIFWYIQQFKNGF
jgi:hypothetical protein